MEVIHDDDDDNDTAASLWLLIACDGVHIDRSGDWSSPPGVLIFFWCGTLGWQGMNCRCLPQPLVNIKKFLGVSEVEQHRRMTWLMGDHSMLL